MQGATNCPVPERSNGGVMKGKEMSLDAGFWFVPVSCWRRG